MDKQDSLVAALAILAGSAVVLSVSVKFQRMANTHRKRQEAMERLQNYSDTEFRRRFRMSRDCFNVICEDIRPKVQPMTPISIARAVASSGSIVHAELRLAATLRILSGGSYLDAGDLFAIHPESIMRSSVWPVCEAICESKNPVLAASSA
jgi:hypothetical protein